jgi:TonB family protein
MPTSPIQLDPETTQAAPETPNPVSADPDAPLSFVPHEPPSPQPYAPLRIRTNRFGDLEEHELIRLLDTIEDERARGRFRESIYLSTFIMLAIVWVLLYGPRYLWHAPQLINPFDAIKQHELVQLTNPVLPHHAMPAPKLDKGTLAKLRAMTPKPTPAPPAPAPPAAMQPLPANPTPNLPLPTAPTPLPRSVAPPIADAPLPQAPSRPSFKAPNNASDAMQQAIQSARSGGGDYSNRPVIGGTNRGTQVGQGVDILSDTQGVDFQPYLARIMREIYEQWLPLIPEEARPPLNKQGVTQIRFKINPDGSIGGIYLDASTHDEALDRAAWGSITGVGQFPPLPKQFHGPVLELRIHYLVNKTQE